MGGLRVIIDVCGMNIIDGRGTTLLMKEWIGVPHEERGDIVGGSSLEGGRWRVANWSVVRGSSRTHFCPIPAEEWSVARGRPARTFAPFLQRNGVSPTLPYYTALPYYTV